MRTDMVYVAKNASWTTIGQAVNTILSLILIVAFANLLPKETYGVYRYILSVAGILNIFALSGANTAVAQAVASGRDGVLKPLVTYQFKWHLMMVAAFLLLGTYYLFKDDVAFGISFFILALFVPATLALNTYGAYLEGRRSFKLVNILSTISIFVYTIGMIVIMLFTDSMLWLIGTYTITTFLASLFFYLYTLHVFKPPSDDEARDVCKYARELTYIRFLGPIVSHIDKIILAHFWGPAQLATYTLAQALPIRGVAFMKSWVAIGFPKFASKNPNQINIVFFRRILQGISIGILACLVYITVAPFVFKYLLPQYIDGILYSQILSLSLIFAIPNRYISLLFASQKMSKQILISNIVNSFLAVALYLVLGIWGGIMGLVIAHTLYSSIGMILNMGLWLLVNRKLS